MTKAATRCAVRRYWLTCGALHSAQNEHQQVLRPLVTLYVTPGEKENERYEEDDTDCASEQAVQILEPENALELLDAEIGIYLQEFRTFLVHLEYAQPLGLGHRRQNAHERAPVNHGKT
jgi:hypothetical protein